MTSRTDRNTSSKGGEDGVLPSARTLGRGLAVVRVLMGLVLLLNGLAKVFGFSTVSVGPYLGNLINRADARFILRFEVFGNEAGGQAGTSVPLVRPIAEFVLDNWGFFQWALTVTEVTGGVLLVLGLASRLGGLLGLGQSIPLAVIYASSNRWLFEQPLEYVPFLVLAIVPSGRVWGLDGALVRRRGGDPGGLRAWPF